MYEEKVKEKENKKERIGTIRNEKYEVNNKERMGRLW